MRTSWRLLIGTAALWLAAPQLPGDDGPPPPLERNRALLEKWRAEPEHYQRLLRDQRAFAALPPERQTAMRRLDQELHALDEATQTRSFRVLERYAAWLEHLSETERRRVESAATPEERLALIRELRCRELAARLPRPDRAEVLALADPTQRWQKLVDLRQKDREANRQWLGPLRLPERLRVDRPEQLSPQVQDFITRVLVPHLPESDRARLKDMEGKRGYVPLLVEIADRYAFSLAPPARKVLAYRDLPEEVRNVLSLQAINKELRRARVTASLDGHWPHYALAVTRVAESLKIALPRQLGPCQADQLPRPVAEALKQMKLDESDRTELEKAETRWPEYPQTVVRLARKHGVALPDMMLPGPPIQWEWYRQNPGLVKGARDFGLGDFSR